MKEFKNSQDSWSSAFWLTLFPVSKIIAKYSWHSGLCTLIKLNPTGAMKMSGFSGLQGLSSQLGGPDEVSALSL